MTTTHNQAAAHALPADPPSAALSRRSLGVPAITLMIVAASAPLTVVAGGTTTTFAVSGSLGAPLGFVAIAVILAVFAVGYTAMSRYVVNAGAFYAYVAQGLGRPIGVGASLVAQVGYNAMQVGIYGLFGFQVSSVLEAKFGWVTPWWVWVVACIVVVGILGINRVDVSAKVLGTLVAAEFIVVTIFDLVSFKVAPEGLSAAALNPATLFGPSLGVILVFSVAAFMGFESGAIYGEEAKDPRTTVPRATYIAIAIIGLFYALSGWAFSVGIGPSAIIAASQEQGPDLMFSFMSEHASVLLSDIMSLLFITSLFAALQAFHNAVARYFYSLGREGVLPSVLGRTFKSGAPWVGSLAQTATALIVVGGFALAGDGFGQAQAMYGDQAFLFPVLTLFTWLTNTGAAALVLLMALTAFAVIGFFRTRHMRLGLWVRVISPAIAGVLMTAMFVAILANFPLMLGQEQPDATTFILPGLIAAGLVIGVVWALILRQASPDVYERIGRGADGGTDTHLLPGVAV